MNGVHDMGGMDGFGPIVREENEPVFHAEWERRMYAIASAIPFPLEFNDDQFRREIERVPAPIYLTSSYYELWYYGILSLLVERGVLSEAQIENLVARSKDKKFGWFSRLFRGSKRARKLEDSVIRGEDVESAVREGASTRAARAEIARRVQMGDRVRVHNQHPYHHTRAPRYVRGRIGTIIIDHGVFNFPDTNSEYRGEQPQHCYTVEFAAHELWGDQRTPGASVTVDLWESYFELI